MIVVEKYNIDFCKDFYLPPADWLDCIGMKLSCCGNFSETKTRYLRIIGNFIQVSVDKEIFSKWSSSVDFVFNLNIPEDRVLLLNLLLNNIEPENENLYSVVRCNQCCFQKGELIND